MYIAPIEELMYQVMRSIYDSGIPINFKGSMVLKACLLEKGYLEDTRHTVDIDANWQSDSIPSAEQMVNSLQSAIHHIDYNLEVVLCRMPEIGQSAGFDIFDRNTGEKLFSMDIDVNRWKGVPTKIYEVNGLHFRGVAPSSMLVDKICALSSDKIFSRIKDFVDLGYLSRVLVLDKNDFMQSLEQSGRVLGDFDGFLNRKDDLKHAYEKFRLSGSIKRESFDELYRSVYAYIADLLEPYIE